MRGYAITCLFAGLFVGSIVGYFLCRRDWKRVVSDLEFEKEMLLDFNEKLIRDRDQIEQRYEMAVRAYVGHLDNFDCQWKKEDRILEAEFVE